MKFNPAVGVIVIAIATACTSDAVAPFAAPSEGIGAAGVQVVATREEQTADGRIAYAVKVRSQRSDISSFQGHLSFTPGTLESIEIDAQSSDGPGALVNTTAVAQGQLRFAMFAPSALTTSGDGAVVFHFSAVPVKATGRVRLSAELDVVGATDGSTISMTPAMRAGSLTHVGVSPARLCSVTLWGDVNADGTTNVVDAQQIARYAVSLSVLNPSAVATRGDVSGDGAVNILDAQQTARFTVGLNTMNGRPGTDMNAAASVTIAVLTPVNPNNGFTPALFAGVNWPIQLGATVRTNTGTDVSGCAAVTWSSSNANTATISSNGTITAVATGSPVFTATSGPATAQMSIPTRVPAIGSFVATPATIASGQAAQLAWSGITGAVQCTINQGVGSAACSGGSATVSPTITTIFRLTATADYQGAVSRDVTVVVAPASKWGVIGDSGADEYRADDNRGGAYAETTLNWVELLVRYRGFNFGAWGTRPAPRRSGYEFDWARSGATSYTLISGGQHTGIAAQVLSGAVDNVVMQIGANDFSAYGAGIYDDIYNATLAGLALQAELDRIYANITLALQTVKAAGPDNIFWISIQDRGAAAVYAGMFPDAAKRQLVTNAISQVNARVTQYATAQGIVALNYGDLANTFLPQVDASGFFHFGGELIDIMHTGDEPHHAILGDDEHGGTVFEGILANFLLTAVRARGINVPGFTNGEILANAGIHN